MVKEWLSWTFLSCALWVCDISRSTCVTNHSPEQLR
jgi:hypothetical protein